MLRLLSGEGGLGCRADAGHVLLNAFQQIERGPRARGMALGRQAHAHDAAEDKGEEADQGVGADAVRQAVVDGGDLDVGSQHAE